MKFTVKTLEGKSQEFDLSGELTVAELKLKVEEALGTPHATQRMIIQGKVLKDEEKLLNYDIEGKTIHVVKNAPSLQSSAPSPHVPVELRPQKLSQEYLYVGITPETLPPPPEVVYLQDTAKDSADNILNTVTTGGHPNALVTVTIHTLGPDGRPIKSSTHTSTSYKPGDACLEDPPHPDPAVAEEELRKKKQKEEERQARRDRLARYRERVKEQQRRGREQTNILEIYQHMTSVRRAIQGAENILEDYLNSQEFKDATEVLEHHLKLKAESEAKMEATEQGSSEEGATAKENVDDTKGATPNDAPIRKDAPQYAMGEDGRPRQHILTDTGMLLPAGAHLYAALIDDIMTLQRRGLQLHEFYARKIYAEEHYEIEDNRCNSKLVTAIQRYHNAMGQAYASLKRVQVTLEGEPPRIVNLTPMPRAANPLLSLLSQPLASDSDNEETSGRGDEEGGSQSIAGLLGSLMATRAAISMMEQEEESQERRTEQQSETSTSQPTDTAPATTGGSEGSTEEKKEEPKEPEKDEDEDDDDEINPFLPGPVHLLQQMIRQRQERERQQQQERTVYIQHDQSFFETIARIRQAVGGPEEEIMPPTLIGHLVEKCMRKLSISEVVTVFGGTTTPLTSIHPTLREFVQEKLLNGAEPTNDNIPEAIAKFVEDLPAVLNQMDPPLPLRTDVDFGLSGQKCCSHMLQEALDLIVNKPDDDPDFAEAIHKWAMNIGTLFTLVLRESLLSANDLTPSLKRISKMMFPDNDTPGVLSMLNSQSLVDKFVDESEKSTLTIEEIVCYLVMKPDAEQMEVDPPQEGTENIEGHGEEVKTTQSWPEAMPKDWIPTIEQDQIEMAKTTVQPPLSTAYLSGMPSKKRKQLESGETESVHISEILGESLESAIQASGATPTSGTTTEDIVREAKQNKDLVQGMGEEFHSSVKDRLQQDPNYDPAKYPSAQKFYQPASTK